MNTINRQLGGNVMNVINDKNVLNVLKKAAEDMPVKENIYIDLAITVNDQVIQTIHLDQNNWMTVFDKIKDWKNIISNVNVNVQGVIYNTFYEMYVPTDMGLQAVLTTKMPILASAKVNTVPIIDNVHLNMDLKLDARLWEHGEYAMSIYNPVVDVWHSIRRVSSNEVELPFATNIVYNHVTSNLKLTFKVNEFLNFGTRTYVKNYVTITEDQENKLMTSCPTCENYGTVTLGDSHKKIFKNTYDLMNTGLQYFTSIYDCESNITPITKEVEWVQAFSSENKNTWLVNLSENIFIN